MKKILMIFFGMILAAPLGGSYAQDKAAQSTSPKIPKGIEALSTYPLALRQAILEVALYPSLLNQVASIQAKAGEAFRRLVANQPQDFQTKVYEISRFPKLINEITAGGKKTPDQVKGLLTDYPREIHPIALELSKKNSDLLEKIEELNFQSNRSFEALIQSYPEATRAAFLQILQHPEILRVLTRYPQFTAHAGQTRLDHGQTTQAGYNALRKELQEENNQARSSALQTADSDPALTQAARDFSRKADLEFNQELDPKKAVQANMDYIPYPRAYLDDYPGFYANPYWFGYPDWNPFVDWW